MAGTLLKMVLAIRTTKKIHFRLDLARGGSTYLICWNGDRRKWSSFVCSWIEDVLYWLLTSLIVFFSTQKKTNTYNVDVNYRRSVPIGKIIAAVFTTTILRRVPWCRNFLHFVFARFDEPNFTVFFFSDSKLLNNKF